MDLECQYCFERFDIKERLPYDLDCEHIICSLCLELTRKRVPAPFCPLHKAKLGLEPTVNLAILEHLKQICTAHSEPISSLCLNDYQLLCKTCAMHHKSCMLLSGNLRNLDSQLTRLINAKKESMENELEHYSKNLFTGYSEDLAMAQRETEKYLKITNEVLQISSEMPLQNRLKSLISTQAIELIDIPHLASSVTCFEIMFSLGITNSKISKFDLEANCLQEYLYNFSHLVLLIFSFFIEVNTEKHSELLQNNSNLDVEITGLGVGLPANVNESICYEYIRIYEGNSKVNLISEVRDIIFNWEKDKVAADLALPTPFKFCAGEVIMIKVKIQGESYFSFYVSFQGPIKILGEETKNFPILYLNFQSV